jgi:hypothetical protein
MKTIEELLSQAIFKDYKHSQYRRIFFWLEEQDIYVMLSESGILFDNGDFIDPEDYGLSADIEILKEYLMSNFSTVIMIYDSGQEQKILKTAKEVLHTIPIFRKYRHLGPDKIRVAYYPELDKYWIVTEDGSVIFEHGVTFSFEELKEMDRSSSQFNKTAMCVKELFPEAKVIPSD